MPYKISGTKSETSRVIIIKESDWSIESETVVSGSGDYEITDLEEGSKLAFARAEDGEVLGYGQVPPISYVISATGGTITTDGDYKIHTFTEDGTFTMLTDGLVEYLVVGGGGGGGSSIGGGGGGGDVMTGSFSITDQAYPVTVGDGGVATTIGNDSVFNAITGLAGGKGGYMDTDGGVGANGGGAGRNNTGGVGSTGYNGGDGITTTGLNHDAGGGGAGDGAAGQHGTDGKGGNGGAGTSSSISGSAVLYGGGGGAGSFGGTPGTGTDGGGNGITNNGTAGAGTANRGSGGGGAGYDGGGGTGGAGGSGIVIIRYSTLA